MDTSAFVCACTSVFWKISKTVTIFHKQDFGKFEPASSYFFKRFLCSQIFFPLLLMLGLVIMILWYSGWGAWPRPQYKRVQTLVALLHSLSDCYPWVSIIWKSDLTDKMKRSFFQAAVVSILLYGCTTWTLTKRLEKKLDGNYTRMLRAILNKF